MFMAVVPVGLRPCAARAISAERSQRRRSNVFERQERMGREKLGLEAKVEFLDGDYRIMRHGTFVRCAVTGQAITLDDLRYWNVARQEAYATHEASLARELGKK